MKQYNATESIHLHADSVNEDLRILMYEVSK
jgi:hypothetical protein